MSEKRESSRQFGFDRDSKRGPGDQWKSQEEKKSNESFDEQAKENTNDEKHSSPFGKIDWAAVRAQPLQNMSKFKDHPPVLKDFYIEDDEVKNMTLEEVKQFRKANFDITVELFKKEDLTYGFGKYEEDKRTPDEIEAYLFERVPKPVRTIEQAFRSFPEILAECKKQNFCDPTPIQSQMWPILLKGKYVTNLNMIGRVIL